MEDHRAATDERDDGDRDPDGPSGQSCAVGQVPSAIVLPNDARDRATSNTPRASWISASASIVLGIGELDGLA